MNLVALPVVGPDWVWPAISGVVALILVLWASAFLVRGGGEKARRRGHDISKARPSEPWFQVDVSRSAQPMIVSTGLADLTNPAVPLLSDRSLVPAHDYVFWLEVGEEVEGSIELDRRELELAGYPPGTRLDVVLFDYPNELELTPTATVGTLELQVTGTLWVGQQPAPVPNVSEWRLLRRLFFPVRTPNREGKARLRCSIYCRGLLIQSRIVSVVITLEGRYVEGALEARADDEDYVLSRTADPAALGDVEPHALSLMLNDDADSTHFFSFWQADGAPPKPASAHIDDGRIKKVITEARDALHRASWGRAEPWSPDFPGATYKYDDNEDHETTFLDDLKSLARAGYHVYDGVINQLAGGTIADAVALRERMREPGFVQIANKNGPTHVLPAAMIYDHNLDTQVDLTICEDFLEALKTQEPLSEQRCFRGECRHADWSVVCPSGFWGFRHNLGFPTSRGVQAAEIDGYRIAYDVPVFTCGVTTDPKFDRRPQHEQVLKALYGGMEWNVIDNREELLSRLGPTNPHIVYLFCHGGVDRGDPWLQVGALNDPYISPDNLRTRVSWVRPRPLVFINGCETTQLDPEMAMEFVSSFVENAGAVGVIGTETTVFEPLACDFAEECLARFLGARGSRVTIGEAVRLARLKLLQDRNPLGLIYIPFVVASMRLEFIPQLN